MHRLLTHDESEADDPFRDGIRVRDGRCVITGVPNCCDCRSAPSFEASYVSCDCWTGFEAAHVFPLERESTWIKSNHSQWITDMDNTIGVSKINSLQNGLLLQKHIRELFNNYLISVNPDVSL